MSAPLTATTMDTQTGFVGSHQSGGTFSNSSSSNTTAANSTGNTGVQPTPKLQMNGVDTQVDTMLSAFDSGVNAASQGLDLDLDFFNKICGDDNTNYSNSNAPSFGLCDASPAFGSSRPSTLTSSFIPSPTTPLFTNGPAQMPCLSPVPPMTQQQQQQQQQQQNLDSFASLLSSARPQLNHQSFPALGMCTPNFNNHSMNTPGFPPNPITNFEEFRAVNRQTISLILAASTSPNVHSPRFQNQFDIYNQKQLVQDFAATAASLDVSTPNTPTVPPMYNNNMSMAAILSGTPTFAAPQQRPSAINTSNSRKTSPIKSSGLSPQNSNIMQQQQQMLTPVFQIPAPMPDLPFSSFNNQAFDLPFSAIMSNNNSGSHGMNGLYGSNDEDGDFDGADTHLGSGSDAASQIPITATKDASGKSIFLCPWDGCGRQFTRPYNLRSHYRQHTGERPFVCTQCPMSFSRHHDLKRHMLIHGGGKQHVCPACSRSFLRSDALKRHLKPAGDDSRLSKCMQIIQIKGISLEGYNC